MEKDLISNLHGYARLFELRDAATVTLSAILSEEVRQVLLSAADRIFALEMEHSRLRRQIDLVVFMRGESDR